MIDKELEQYYDTLFKLDGVKTEHFLCPRCYTRHRVFLNELNLRCPICGYKYNNNTKTGVTTMDDRIKEFCEHLEFERKWLTSAGHYPHFRPLSSDIDIAFSAIRSKFLELFELQEGDNKE